MPRRHRLLTCATALLLSLPVAVHAASKHAGHEALDPAALSAKLLELHNDERAKEGAGALKLNDKLTSAAQKYAEFLASSGKFGHNEDGSPGSRIKDADFKWHACGENIAKGQKDPASVVNAWMHSSGHRHNILSKSYHEVGFGMARTAKGQIVWVTDFGSGK